jgi:hypothetical protein
VPVIIHTIHGYGITPAQPLWLRRILILLERMTGWITTHWIAVAQADIEKGIEWGLFDRTQVSVVRPGIDPQPFQTDIDAPYDRRCWQSSVWDLLIIWWERSPA